RIKAMRRDWEANELREFLARQPESRSEYRTGSGLPVERVYTPADIADTGFEEIGLPGRYPFTRGPYPTMYRGRLWTMRQIAGYGTGSDTNARFHYLIAQGQTGLSVDFDMPTLMGYDSDDPRAVGEVGREGVAVDTLDDVEALFAGIDLERISVSMTINPTAWILLAIYVALARSRGDGPNKLSGRCQTDIPKEYMPQQWWIFPIRPSRRAAERGEAHAGALRRGAGRVHASALPLPDRRGHADEGAADEQHRAHRAPGARRGARRRPIAPHQRARRGVRDPVGARDEDRAPHPADHRRRDARDGGGGSARGLILCRGADQPDRGRGGGDSQEGGRSGRDGEGDRGGVLPARNRRLRVRAGAPKGLGRRARDRRQQVCRAARAGRRRDPSRGPRRGGAADRAAPRHARVARPRARRRAPRAAGPRGGRPGG